jgi:hypothetical protein
MEVLIAGDFAPRYRLAESVDSGNFQEIFPDCVRVIVKSADFSLVNLESPITETAFRPIPKCGPNLHCSPKAVDAIKYAGFTGVTLANNHIMDYGAEGLHKTLGCCSAAGFDVVGVGNNLSEAASILYLETDGKKLAVINCCEHEFSIATDTHPGSNPLNPIRQFHQIRETKANADYVMVIVHGGHEHFQLPSPRMQETYRFFIEAGADAVINHHQHCYSGYEVYNGKPIFYGLGNFCFDDRALRNSTWNQGYMVKMDFYDENVGFTLYPYTQCNNVVAVNLLTAEERGIFDKRLSELNEIIGNESLLKEKVQGYYERCAKGELAILEPYRGKVFSKLYDLGLLPRFVNGEKLSSMLNHIYCESHRDKLIDTLIKKNNVGNKQSI